MTTPEWHDPTRSVADRVSSLLARMTLEEKVAQLGSRWVNNDMEPRDEAEANPETNLNVAPMQDVFAASSTLPLREASRHGLGHLTRVYGGTPLTVAATCSPWVNASRATSRRSARPRSSASSASCSRTTAWASRRWCTRSA